MKQPERVTEPFVDVAEFLWWKPSGAHGYEIKRKTKRSGPTVYNNLDRLRELGWGVGQWADEQKPGLPARRIYRLTPEGRDEVQALLLRLGRLHPNQQFCPASGPSEDR